MDVLSTRSAKSQSYSGAPYLAPDGSTATAKDIWITHSGDLGMRMIAQRIIDTLNM